MRIQAPERLLRYISSTPWMIHQPKAEKILGYLEFRASGGVKSEAEIRAITSERKFDTAASGSGVAVIPLFGVIAQRADSFDESSGFASLERFMGCFREALADDTIGTIVMHIDSPGGSVDGIAEATDEIFSARAKKQLVAVADPMICSAAYSLASACHEIVVPPSGIVGSIGVIAIHAEFSRAEELGGIGVTVVTAGRYKGEGNAHEPLSDTAESHIQEAVDDYYGLFVEAVARNRGATVEAVQKGYGEGRALTAKRAVKAKLADRIATIDQVLAEMGVRRQVRAVNQEGTDLPIAAGTQLIRIESSVGVARPSLAGSMQLDPAPIAQAARILTSRPRSDDSPPPPPAPADPDDDEEDDDPNDPRCTDTPPSAPGGAAADPKTPPESEPHTGKETSMPENGSGPQTDGGAEAANKRATDIMQLCIEHGMADRAPAFLASSSSADAIARQILKEKGDATRASATSAQPKEERPKAPAQIRRRFSSKEDEPGFGIGMAMLGMGAACAARKNGRQLDPAQFVADGGFPEIAAAMRSDRFDQGGAWVPEHYMAGEFIELLRPASAIRKLSPRGISLEGGTATLPGLAGGATSYYKAEGSPGTVTGGTTKRVTLLARELMTFVPMTTQLVRRADPDAAAMIRDDAVAASAQRFDLAAIRGDGTESSPKGLKNLMASANQIPANGTVNLANVTTDLGKLRLALLASNVKMLRPGFLFAPRTEIYLRSLRDGNGNYAFREEMNLGKVDGYPFASTTQIPTNLGGGTNESEVYLADFADVVVGEEPTMQIDVFDQLTYYDGSAWQSAGQNNEVVLRVVEHHDIVLRHAESAAMLTGVTWGA